jgi:hypothetical protein
MQLSLYWFPSSSPSSFVMRVSRSVMRRNRDFSIAPSTVAGNAVTNSRVTLCSLRALRTSASNEVRLSRMRPVYTFSLPITSALAPSILAASAATEAKIASLIGLLPLHFVLLH